jgi:uncharacterized damage-inducible protein DinB
MITPEDVRTLFAYDAWANRRMLDACAALAPEQFTRDLGSSFRSVRDTLAHIMGAEWLWLERFQGRTPGGLPDANQFADLASLRTRWTEFEKGLLSYVDGLSAADLARSFDYKDLKGNPHSNVLWQTLQHLANHGTYHRGQVTTLLRQLGAKPAGTDLIGFYRERAAQATQAAH